MDKIKNEKYFAAYQKMLLEKSKQEIIFCLGCEKCKQIKTAAHITTLFSSGNIKESFLWIETNFIEALGFDAEHLHELFISPKRKKIRIPVMILKPWMD